MTTTPTASPELPDLDRLEALARAATAGSWLYRRDPGNPIGAQHCVKLAGENGAWVCDCIDNADRSTVGGIAGERNAAFIASANPAAVLALIALARRAQPEGEAPQAGCTVPPEGWYCTRAPRHDGPCAARPIAQQAAASGALEKSARALAEKWHKDAVDTGFATSEAAVELLEVLDAATSAPGTPEAQADLPRLYRFDCYVGKTKMAAGVGVHGSTMEEAEQKARKMIDKGETIKFESNRPCHATRKCHICAEYERAAQLDGGQEGSKS